MSNRVGADTAPIPSDRISLDEAGVAIVTCCGIPTG